MSLPIITNIRDRNHFLELLNSNPGMFFIKFGAKWCGPCKTIDEGIKAIFQSLPSYIQTAIIDIDECTDVYSFLKSKRVVNGVPVILCYNKDNISHIPDDIVIGADKQKINEFFIRCSKNNID
jgi:thiol-disulfide isomerase/thioredoxin